MPIRTPATFTENPKRRWKGTSVETRRLAMVKLTQRRLQVMENRRIAAAIERVKAAGYRVELAS